MIAPEIVVAPSFEEAVKRLDPSEARRTSAFLDKLTEDPGRGGMRFEIVRKQPDRNICSARVSMELRAIGYNTGGTLTLLWVAHHDEAYVWARTKCIICHPLTGRVLKVYDAPPAED